jgi:LAO/AO transport system kinase
MEMVLSYDKNIVLAKQGNRRELARLLTIIESGERLPIEESNESWVLGVTGPPGVGKSTLIGVMIDEWVRRGEKVAVLAIDSMINLLSYCGWTKIIIETVGSGQSEIRIVAFANRIMLVDGPDRGDIIQAEKAGIIELADVIVINKSDLPNSDAAAISIKKSLEFSNKGNDTIVMLTSSINNNGVSELIEELDKLHIDKDRSILRTKERLLSAWDYRLLSNPSLNDILLNLESGAINLDEALEHL